VARVEEARALAPDSPTVLFTLATLHRTRGDLAAALPLAARAAELAPTGYRQVAFHAVVLAESGRRDEARRLAERLEVMVPQGPDEFGWTVVMHSALNEQERVLELIDTHPDWLATDAYLRLARLEALVLLDRPEEAGHLLAALPEEDLADPSVAFLQRVHAMRTAPLVAVLDLTADWLSAGYGETGMRMLAQAAERSGELPAVRAHIRRWLAEPGTPQEAWFDARPWFAGTAWREALEAHVAVRPDVVPSILLLSDLDAVTDRARVHRLADDFRRRDHPLAEMAQLLYFDTLDCSRAERLRQLEQHVDTHPGATLCLVALVTEHRADDPERARRYLERLEEQAADRAALRIACDYLRCELLVGEGEAERALAVLNDLPVEMGRPYVDPGRYALLCAQAAFLADREQELRDHLDPLLADREDSVHAAALLLRWSEQAARGLPITYREDVDAWLAARGDEARSLRSTSAQGILLAEGRVDSAWAGMATSGRSPDTFALVRALERLADGDGDLTGLRAVADSPRRGDFGPSLARTILSRRPG
jgi:hypothetical protein